jgi:hypothetical protein
MRPEPSLLSPTMIVSQEACLRVTSFSHAETSSNSAPCRDHGALTPTPHHENEALVTTCKRQPSFVLAGLIITPQVVRPHDIGMTWPPPL